MSFWSTMLRLILALSILLNGSGFAMAATQGSMSAMDMTHVSQRVAGQRTAQAELGCHRQHMAHTQVVAVATAQLADAGMPPAKAKHAPHDCCKSGLCDCACAYQAQTSHPALVFDHAMGRNRPLMHVMESGHAAPRLPHLMRPPIG